MDQVVADSPDPIRLGGISRVLAGQIAAMTDMEVRDTILGHVQRGGTPVGFDRVLATVFGYEATRLIEAGKFNRMIAMVGGKITSVPIEDVAGHQRVVPIDCVEIMAARAVGTCFGDEV